MFDDQDRNIRGKIDNDYSVITFHDTEERVKFYFFIIVSTTAFSVWK